MEEWHVSLPWERVKWKKSVWPYVKTPLQNKTCYVQFFSSHGFGPPQFNLTRISVVGSKYLKKNSLKWFWRTGSIKNCCSIHLLLCVHFPFYPTFKLCYWELRLRLAWLFLDNSTTKGQDPTHPLKAIVWAQQWHQWLWLCRKEMESEINFRVCLPFYSPSWKLRISS